MASASNFRECSLLFAVLIQTFFIECMAIGSSNKNLVDWDGFSHSSAVIVVSATNQTIAARPATFGPAFGNEFTGQLVRVAGDGFGCQSTTEHGINGTEYTGNIILVQRGKCSFVDKVMNIQRRGGIAVIVGDDVPQDWLFTKYPDGIILSESSSLRRSIQCHYTFGIDNFGKLCIPRGNPVSRSRRDNDNHVSTFRHRNSRQSHHAVFPIHPYQHLDTHYLWQ
jgi:hypothetical protein